MPNQPTYFPPAQKEKAKKRRPLWSRILRGVLRWTLRTLLFLLLLLIAAWFALQTTFVQNWAIKKVGAYLSDALHTVVKVDHVELDFFDRITVEGLYIQDLQGDTLLYAGFCNADIALFSLFKNQLRLDGVKLDNPVLHYRRRAGEKDFNAQFLLDYFSGPDEPNKPKDPSKDFLFALNHLTITNLDVIFEDHPGGMEAKLRIDHGDIRVNDMKLPYQLVDVASIFFDNVDVQVHQFERDSAFFASLPQPAPAPQDTAVAIPDSTAPKPYYALGDFVINKARIRYDDDRHAPLDKRLFDAHHFQIDGLHFGLSNFVLNDQNINAEFRELQFSESHGMALEQFAAKIAITPTSFVADSLVIKTPLSEIRDSIGVSFDSFDDFKDFANKVRFKNQLHNAKISVADLVAVVPSLSRNKFIAENILQTFTVSGEIRGTVNSLKGKNIEVHAGNHTYLRAGFSLKDIASASKGIFDVNFDDLRTNARDLTLLLQGVQLPREIPRLGNIRFKGFLTGTFTGDLTAQGDLRTEIGEVTTNMRFDLRPGLEKAIYDGTFAVKNFQLGTWLGNNDFGPVSASGSVSDGIGLHKNSMKAKFAGRVQLFTFKGYEYKSLVVDGNFDRLSFDGTASTDDPNANLFFKGKVDFNYLWPRLNAEANIINLDLVALKLNDRISNIHGRAKIYISGLKPDEIRGWVDLRDLSLRDGDKTYKLDSLVLKSYDKPYIGRAMTMQSDIMNANLTGNFMFESLPEVLAQFVEDKYPEFASRLNIHGKVLGYKTKFGLSGDTILLPIRPDYGPQQMTFHAEWGNAAALTGLIHKDLTALNNGIVDLEMDTRAGTYSLSAEVEEAAFGEFRADSFHLVADVMGSVLHNAVSVASLAIGSGVKIPDIRVTNRIDMDTLTFAVFSGSPIKNLSSLNLGGQMFFENQFTKIVLQNTRKEGAFSIYGRDWTISPGNHIRFKKDFLEIKNVKFVNGEQSVTLSDNARTGLDLLLSNISVPWLNSLVNTDKFRFGGALNGRLGLLDFTNRTGFYTNLDIDHFTINDSTWGQFRLKAYAPSVDDAITIQTLEINSPNKGRLSLDKTKLHSTPNLELNQIKKDSFDVAVQLENISPEIIGYFLEGEVSNVRGSINATAQLWGNFKNPRALGSFLVKDASFHINLLNTTFFIDSAKSNFDEYGFHFHNEHCRDADSAWASINGDVGFVKLRDPYANLEIEFPTKDVAFARKNTPKDKPVNNRFMMLNTTKANSNVFYGKAYAKEAFVKFTGPFVNLNMDVRAVTGIGTSISIPVSNEGSASSIGFIKFVNKKTLGQAGAAVKPPNMRGLNLSMAITATPDAEANIILNENSGDILTGRGWGDLLLNFQAATSWFTLEGLYTIEQGKYLFTLGNYNVPFISKPFSILKGGTINWSGDPYNAQINLSAKYDNLNVGYYDLVANSLFEDPDLRREARKPTPVALTMKLTGQLFQPDIDFDIELPQVSNLIKPFVDNQLKALKEDKSALNRQVFGLLVMKRFLPEGNVSEQGGTGQAAGTGLLTVGNTLGEMLTSQLSRYVSQLLNETLANEGFITSFDFNVNFNLMNDYDYNNAYSGVGSYVGAGLTTGLLNDRILIRIGANLDVGSGYAGNQNTQNGAFLGGDFLIEYLITADGRFRIRAYSRGENDIFNNNITRYGGGFSFRYDFDDIRDFTRWLRKKKKQKE